LRFKFVPVTISPISDRVPPLTKRICAATGLLADESAFARLVAAKIVIKPAST
jgi:hypothetical protein